MLTDKELREVDEYIRTFLAPEPEAYEEIDNFIVDCSLDESLLQQLESLAVYYMRLLRNTMEKEFAEHQGVTIKMIAAQERLYQLKILKDKSNGHHNIKDLAMLCIVSSFDLYLLELQKKQAEKGGSNTLE